ncbi:hypothetical protein AKJ08_3146 [Vulgatibacter incomptus]|uniref:Uncharacterized protein n=1 Tax=Vulgatibacter incomptus TaxID=1391653 RepID=A0A0K1PI35_9BACT|nr:hypothetical protein AKJ08_3146 [Vulgatibacter incomptus]
MKAPSKWAAACSITNKIGTGETLHKRVRRAERDAVERPPPRRATRAASASRAPRLS